MPEHEPRRQQHRAVILNLVRRADPLQEDPRTEAAELVQIPAQRADGGRGVPAEIGVADTDERDVLGIAQTFPETL